MLNWIFAILLFGSVLGVQEIPLVDLTSTVPQKRLREPEAGSGSGSMVTYEGRNPPADPVSLELVSLQTVAGENGEICIYEILLRNIGNQAVEIPVDPSSRSVEPTSAKVPYEYLNGEIWLSTEPDAKARLAGNRLSLYGAPTAAGSLRTLKPGAAIRIRAKLPLDALLGRNQMKSMPPPQVRAFFALSRDSVSIKGDGRLHVHVQSVFASIQSGNALALRP